MHLQTEFKSLSFPVLKDDPEIVADDRLLENDSVPARLPGDI